MSGSNLELLNAVKQVRSAITSFADSQDALAGRVENNESEMTEQRKQLNSLAASFQNYSKQLPLLASGSSARDPEYRGAFPNAKAAEGFGAFVLAGLHPDGGVRRACAELFGQSGVTIRDRGGTMLRAAEFAKALGESSDPAGGYLVPDDYARTIIRLVNDYGVARAYLTKVPMSSDRQFWPKRTGGLTVYYPDEGVAPTASDLTLGRIQLVAKKWAVLTYFSRELEDDAVVAVGELIAQEIALALATAEDTNAFMGDGTSTYAGITGVFNSANVGAVVMGGGDTTFAKAAWGDLVDVMNAVPAWALKRPDCAWYMSPGIKGTLMKIVEGTTGAPLLTDPNKNGFNELIGYPVRVSNALPGLADEGVSTKFLAFGSLSAWGMMGIRRGLVIQRSTEVKFLEGQVALMAVPRQDIQEAEGTAMATLSTAAA